MSESITIVSLTSDKIVFDLDKVHVYYVNALRRVLLSEVPTWTIESVEIYRNTSVIPDEVLVHRLGLVPISVPPGHTSVPSLVLNVSGAPKTIIKTVYAKDMAWDTAHTIKKHQECSKLPPLGTIDTSEMSTNSTNFPTLPLTINPLEKQKYQIPALDTPPPSPDYKTNTQGPVGMEDVEDVEDVGIENVENVENINTTFDQNTPIFPSPPFQNSSPSSPSSLIATLPPPSNLSHLPSIPHPNIILAKLGETQQIHLRAFCAQGIGATHAKWSPVATAVHKKIGDQTYRFTVESAGQYDPKDLVRKALDIIQSKCTFNFTNYPNP